MHQTRITPPYDRFLDWLVEKATPAAILAFEIPAADCDRITALLERQDANTLTPAETAELEQCQYVDRMISALKAKAARASRPQETPSP